MKLKKWIIVVILLGIPALASAEFYRYVDKEGKVHYTDDIANIPADQRPKVNEYEDAYYPSSSEEKTDTERQEDTGSQESLKEHKEVPGQTEPLAEEGKEKTAGQRLKETLEKLRKEYQALTQERAELDKAASGPLTPAVRKGLIKKTADYNARLEDYEKRRQAYDKEVEAYNAGLKKEAESSKGEKDLN